MAIVMLRTRNHGDIELVVKDVHPTIAALKLAAWHAPSLKILVEKEGQEILVELGEIVWEMCG